MGICRLETFLHRDVPNEYCWEANIKELAAVFRKETGRDPVIVADGTNCQRKFRDPNERDWVLGGQLKEYVSNMKEFAGAFQKIGIQVVFFFDGATQEKKRITWIERRIAQANKVQTLFRNLKENNLDVHMEYLLPPIVGAIGRFVAKFECNCDVHMSLTECDVEMAEYAFKEGCFGILSRDTDFVILRGARHYFSIERLDINTMTTLTYDKNGLLRALDINASELLLLVSLLGTDIIPVSKLCNFHKRICGGLRNDIFNVIPRVVSYIKQKNVPENFEEFGYLHEIAKDIFHNENMAKDLQMCIRSYLPPETSEINSSKINDTRERVEPVDDNWNKILEMARKKHLSCSVTTHLYPVMVGDAYELSIALESMNGESTASIYLPLRQRIYGILFHDRPQVQFVKEWCMVGLKCPTKPIEVSVTRIRNIERFHPGLLKLWDENCPSGIRWKLFTESLTCNKKLDAGKLEKLGFPYAVPVATLFYLHQECGNLNSTEVEMILAHAAAVNFHTAEELKALGNDVPCPYIIHLSTIFHRGITTVLFLLAACGFPLQKAMPWYYFDGRLLLEKYTQMVKKRYSITQLCEDRADIRRIFRNMKELVIPTQSWR